MGKTNPTIQSKYSPIKRIEGSTVQPCLKFSYTVSRYKNNSESNAVIPSVGIRLTLSCHTVQV